MANVLLLNSDYRPWHPPKPWSVFPPYGGPGLLPWVGVAKPEREMTDFVIEKDIPLPPHWSHDKVKYPFGEMAVGASIQISGYNAFLTARNSAGQWGKCNNRKFTGRKNDDGGRIWRIE